MSILTFLYDVCDSHQRHVFVLVLAIILSKHSGLFSTSLVIYCFFPLLWLTALSKFEPTLTYYPFEFEFLKLVKYTKPPE